MSESNSTVTYRDIPGFPGYRVGDDGSVWSCRPCGPEPASGPRPSRPWTRLNPIENRPYPNKLYVRYRVGLRCDGKTRTRYVHHLVLEAFVGQRPEGTEAAHEDDNGANNQLSNLSWKTHADNMKDLDLRGRRRIGSQTHHATMTESDVVVILDEFMHLSGPAYTRCRALASSRPGVTPHSLYGVVIGETWKHVPRPPGFALPPKTPGLKVTKESRS